MALSRTKDPGVKGVEQARPGHRRQEDEGQGVDPEPRLSSSLHVSKASKERREGHEKAGPEGPAKVAKGVEGSSDGVAQNAAVLADLEDTFGLALELPDPLARDVELFAQLG